MEDWIVVIIVAYATYVVANLYMPQAIRQAVRQWLIRTSNKLGWHGLAKKLEPKVRVASTGCGGCCGCGSQNDDTPVVDIDKIVS